MLWLVLGLTLLVVRVGFNAGLNYMEDCIRDIDPVGYGYLGYTGITTCPITRIKWL
jgi:hypothetical protein